MIEKLQIARWQKEYEARGEAAFGPKELSGNEALQAHVAELERFCGQLAVENAVLKKVLSMLAPRTTRGNRADAKQ